MWIADGWKEFELLDCGRGEKLERWGNKLLVRPDPQAIWNTPVPFQAGSIRMAGISAANLAVATGRRGSCPSGGR